LLVCTVVARWFEKAKKAKKAQKPKKAKSCGGKFGLFPALATVRVTVMYVVFYLLALI
jgi:hypothetical protein